MKLIPQLGKWLFIIPFAAFGLLHFGPLEFSLPYIPDFLPFPAFWVYFSGTALLAFVVSAVWSKYDRLAGLLLALMLLLFVVLIHLPKAIGGDFLGVIAAFRDLAMAGAALLYASAFARDPRFAFSLQQLQ